jgi:hypothetical protein
MYLGFKKWGLNITKKLRIKKIMGIIWRIEWSGSEVNRRED